MLESQLGPRQVSRLLREIAQCKNNFLIANEFEVSLWTVRMLRVMPNECLLYALEHGGQNEEVGRCVVRGIADLGVQQVGQSDIANSQHGSRQHLL
jgi:hypothetical protein